MKNERLETATARLMTAGPTIFLWGLPRSGTTWLAKIVDSHPDVVYRHEPDSVVRNANLPLLCAPDAIKLHKGEAARYIERLKTVRTPKTAASQPQFAKSFYGPGVYHFRRLFAYAAKGLEKAMSKSVPIPDLISTDGRRIRYAIKSIDALGRARLYAEAVPDSRTIIIVRHPCGQIASVMRGVALSRFTGRTPPWEDEGILRLLCDTEQARRRGLDFPMLMEKRPVERMAWRWTIFNEKALEETDGLETVRPLSYEELGGDPLNVSRALFEFLGLSWMPQTERFIGRSTRGSGRKHYYSIHRDPLRSAEAWKNQLDGRDVDAILAITAESRAGRFLHLRNS
jgi:hypothetical protein